MSDPRPRMALMDLALSDTGFVFDPRSGATFTVNPSGLCALQAIKEGLSRDEAGDRLRQRFAMPTGGDPGRDLDEFLQLLRHHGLVPTGFSF